MEELNRRKALEEICGRFGVAILYAFGSQAREVRDWVSGSRERFSLEGSDVDIGVLGDPRKRWSAIEKVELAIALEDLFECPRVDLVVLSEADPFLAAEIVRGERLFSRDEEAADEYDLFVLRRAGDLIPLERERMALILGEDT